MSPFSIFKTSAALPAESVTATSYLLRCPTLHDPNISPCRSYDLIVSNVHGSASLKDLTVREDRALSILNRVYEEKVRPEELPWIAEDLLADPDFVC